MGAFFSSNIHALNTQVTDNHNAVRDDNHQDGHDAMEQSERPIAEVDSTADLHDSGSDSQLEGIDVGLVSILPRDARDGGARYFVSRAPAHNFQAIRQHFQNSWNLCESAIPSDNGEALCVLDCQFLHDRGLMKKDISRSVSLFRRASDAGHVPAMVLLARILQVGVDDVQQDMKSAVDLYERAIDADDHDAMFFLGELLFNAEPEVEKDMVRSVSLLRRASDAGHVRAMVTLAQILHNGTFYVQKDAQSAVDLCERAIDADDHNAMYFLAYMLWNGADDVEKDLKRSVSLMQRASEAGHVRAMVNLARILQDGINNVPKDVPSAIGMYERAIDCDDTRAMIIFAELLLTGAEGVERTRHVQFHCCTAPLRLEMWTLCLSLHLCWRMALATCKKTYAPPRSYTNGYYPQIMVLLN